MGLALPIRVDFGRVTGGGRLGEIHHPIVPCFPYFPTLWICNFCQFNF